MKISNRSVDNTGSRLVGVALTFAILAAGSASAETYRHGDSTAIIQQSGGSGKSESRITRYRDGQRIITRDGNSTDITIQRTDRLPPSDDWPDNPGMERDRFEQRFSGERFSRIMPKSTDCNKRSSTRDMLKQRMLDRMRNF